MNNKQLMDDINFADKNTSTSRNEELMKLKELHAMITSAKKSDILNTNYGEVDNSFSNDLPSQDFAGNESGYGKQIILSNNAGRLMNDNQRQNGYSNALMLGIISFIFEIIFVAVAIFLYK